MLYHTYFESPSEKDDSNNRSLIKPSEPGSIHIYKVNNTKISQLHNPTIAIDQDANYLVAYEKREYNGSSSIWLTNSSNGTTWQPPVLHSNGLPGATKPYLEYVQDIYYILSFDFDEKRYVQVSSDGFNWSTPKPSNIFSESQSLFYSDEYILLADQTGLWLLDYEDFQNSSNDSKGKLLMPNDFTNASILMVNEYEFIIVYENSIENYNSIIFTTVQFEKPENTKNTVKWDLLVIFIILEIILVTMVVKEVARD